ncbi:MAG: ATP-binding cassette domain-containing protein [Rhodospirillaceae bacterium]|jgi:glycine betaine/proline transport system ATP-binding protein
MTLITLNQASKVFGKDVEQALALSRAGVEVADIREQTGATVALAETSLSICDGEVFMIMGLSGSGKSTLLRLINRLISPTSGTVSIDGVDLAALSSADLRALRRKRLAMVFQGFGLLPHRSVLENIGFGLEIQGRRKADRLSIAETWVERVGLTGFAESLPNQLSGGMRQRVGLARALASGADILLMDEPFSALDPLIRREMQDLLLELQRDLNKTIVFVTHDLAEAVKVGTRIAILRDGAIVQIGSGRDIIDHPADAYVRAFTEDLRLPVTP